MIMYKFELSKNQIEKYESWDKSLPKLEPGHFGASGGGYWFRFTPTGIGDVVVVGRDDVPELDCDLTDWDNF